MNLYFEYLRHLYPLVLIFIVLWLAFKAFKAYTKGNRTRAGRFIFTGLIASLFVTHEALVGAWLALLFAFPHSEADLIKELHRETGVELPPSARVVSYRTSGGFFGYWSGFMKANVNCQDMAQLDQLSGILFNRQTQFEISSKPKGTKLDVWRKSRFTIPPGSQIVEYNDGSGSKQTIYAIDSKNCTVYYHRFTID